MATKTVTHELRNEIASALTDATHIAELVQWVVRARDTVETLELIRKNDPAVRERFSCESLGPTWFDYETRALAGVMDLQTSRLHAASSMLDQLMAAQVKQ